jgi:general secretion pathway protein G
MFTRARPPVREARLQSQAPARAFTLIELLTVISIIAILSAISLNVVKGVKERSAVGLAKAELAALSQALEMYKLQYGDYPQTGMSADTVAVPATAPSTSNVQYRLFNALAGKLGPKLDPLTSGKSFVDLARFSLFSKEAADMPTPTGNTPVSNAFLDPWGQTYVYYYKTVATGTPTWRSPSYVLFSVGPDGEKEDADITALGVVNHDTATMDPKNVDNIYANR